MGRELSGEQEESGSEGSREGEERSIRLEDLMSSRSLSPREHRDRSMSAIMVASCREVNRHKSLASELSALSNYIYILYLPRSAPVRSFAAVYREIY